MLGTSQKIKDSYQVSRALYENFWNQTLLIFWDTCENYVYSKPYTNSCQLLWVEI